MKILIGNQYLGPVGGTQAHAYTMAVELLRRGHEVWAYAQIYGETAAKMGQAGVKIVGLERDLKRLSFHLAIANQRTTAMEIGRREAAHKLIQIGHGIQWDSTEKPAPGILLYCGVSQEVVDHYGRGFVLPNPVDPARFKFSPTGPRVRKVLSFCRTNEGRKITAQAVQLYERQSGVAVQLVHLDNKTNSRWDVENDIRWADLVVGLGRSAIEAAVMGRSIYVGGARDYQGPLSDGRLSAASMEEAGQANYSGRAMIHAFKPRALAWAMLHHNQRSCRELSKVMLEVHAVDRVVDQLLTATT